MKRRKKKELDKAMGEDFQSLNINVVQRLPCPFLASAGEHSQLLILECKRGLQRFQGWNTKCFVFFSKHPQQIKCTRISLEFATVQLICGILSRSLPRFIPPSWLPTKPCQPGKHIPTPLCAHTPALCLSVLLEFCPLLHMRH